MRIVITDLTRFRKNNDDLCTAGIDIDTGRCVRPMPYLKMSDCVDLGILPGAILEGKFKPKGNLVGPHQEDATYSGLKFVGPCTSEEFEKALCSGLYPSIEKGFEIKLVAGQKHIPPTHSVLRSIITIEVKPKSLEVVEDSYNPGKVKVHFADSTDCQFRYMPITDFGFFRYADAHRTTQALGNLNGFISRQEKVYLRIGLSRAWTNPSNVNGYWLQVNGIYTFPAFFEAIRSYK